MLLVVVFPVFATTVGPFTLTHSSGQLTYELHEGTFFYGSIVTSGGVRVWINAPNGTQIINLGIIDATTDFSFVSHQNGVYTVNFENDLQDSVSVTFNFQTDPELPDNNTRAFSTLPTSYILIPILIAVIGSILIIFLIRRKKTSTLE